MESAGHSKVSMGLEVQIVTRGFLVVLLLLVSGVWGDFFFSSLFFSAGLALSLRGHFVTGF